MSSLHEKVPSPASPKHNKVRQGNICPARPEQASQLTSISFLSKAVWNYPQQYLKLWKQELTITETYIKNNLVFIHQFDHCITGYFSLVEKKGSYSIGNYSLPGGIWLDHMFILPELSGLGIGRRFCSYLHSIAKKLNCQSVHVLSDPNSTGFYTKMGFSHRQEIPSTISGRTTPWMTLTVQKHLT